MSSPTRKVTLRSFGVAIGALLCLAQTAFAQPPAPVVYGLPDAPVVLHAGTKCLDINEPQIRTSGARVQLWGCDGRPSQVWRFDHGHIVNQASGRCLDVHGPDAGFNGARIQAFDCHGGANQGWRFERGQLIAQVDGRCLDVHEPDVDRNAAHVQTWDCRGSANQQWGIEPVGLVRPARDDHGDHRARDVRDARATRDVEAGPLWNNGDADRKCPGVCSPAKWSGQWRTTVQGRMSVCGCEVNSAPANPDSWAGVGPRPMDERHFDDLLQAMKSEAFPASKMGVLEGASRENYFVIAQLKRIIESFTFPSDKIRAVEIVAPRVLDRRNAFTLYSVFDFDSEKEQARAIFDRLK